VEPFQGTDQQVFLIERAGLFHAALKDRQHVFGAGCIIPVDGTHAGKSFFPGQNHTYRLDREAGTVNTRKAAACHSGFVLPHEF
jgi:hypothetical protein